MVTRDSPDESRRRWLGRDPGSWCHPREKLDEVAQELIPVVVSRIKTRLSAWQYAGNQPGKMKRYLRSELASLTRGDAREIVRISDHCVLDLDDMLLYVSLLAKEHPRERESVDKQRLVVPAGLTDDVLQHCHADIQDEHQDVTRTYERVRQDYHWKGVYVDVERFVKMMMR
ncbi:reverse transcriptase, partial [Globisporangium splendens]